MHFALNTWRGVRWIPSRRARLTNFTTEILSPPTAKNPSSMPIASIPKTSHTKLHSFFSSSLRGALLAITPKSSGIDSALRLIFPLGNLGSFLLITKYLGTK